jgi:hypothetical protein
MIERISEAEIERLKRDDDFVARVSQIVPDLKRKGGEWHGTCPEHGGRSFYVVEGKGFAHCFGCAKSWDPVDWIMQFEGVGFVDAVKSLGGNVAPIDPEVAAAYARQRELRERQIARDQERKILKAREIWRGAVAIDGTPAARYLEGRGLIGPFPPSLRFHPALPARWEESAGARSAKLPALVAAVQAPAGALQTVHRIYLEEMVGGAVVKAGAMPADQVKKLHGSPGTGAVRLSPRSELLAIAEGVETGLAVLGGLAAAGRSATVWSSVSAGQLLRIDFPRDWRPRSIAIFADNDASGVGRAMAIRAADRFRRMGVPNVSWRMPAMVGLDWLDTETMGRARK